MSQTNWATPSWNSSATVPRLFEIASRVARRPVETNCSVLSPFSRNSLYTSTTGINDSSCRSQKSRRIQHKSEKDSSLEEYTRPDRMSRSTFSIDLFHVSVSSVNSELALTHCIKRLLWLHCKVFKILILVKTHVTLPWEYGLSTHLQKNLTSVCGIHNVIYVTHKMSPFIKESPTTTFSRFSMSHIIILAFYCSNFTGSRVC